MDLQVSQTSVTGALPDDPSMQRKSSHAVLLSGQNPSIDNTQLEIEERLAQIKALIHPFLNAPPEDVTFLPDALYCYIKENKIYGIDDDKE
jgi:hypothetical protein